MLASRLPYVAIKLVLIGLLSRPASRQPAVEFDPGLRLRLAVERTLGPDNDTRLVQRGTVSSIPVNEDVKG